MSDKSPEVRAAEEALKEALRKDREKQERERRERAEQQEREKKSD